MSTEKTNITQPDSPAIKDRIRVYLRGGNSSFNSKENKSIARLNASNYFQKTRKLATR